MLLILSKCSSAVMVSKELTSCCRFLAWADGLDFPSGEACYAHKQAFALHLRILPQCGRDLTKPGQEQAIGLAPFE